MISIWLRSLTANALSQSVIYVTETKFLLYLHDEYSLSKYIMRVAC